MATATPSSGGADHTVNRVVLGELTTDDPDVDVTALTRSQVEPYLAALLQVEHLNLLVGAGLTSALCHAAGGTPPDMGAKLAISDAALNTRLEKRARESVVATHRDPSGIPNVEDRLRVAIETLVGLEHANDPRAKDVAAAVESALGGLRDGIVAAETLVKAKADDDVGDNFTLQDLLSGFLRSFAGRTPTRDRLHIFTTNYDRVIEWGSDRSALRLLDRFVGTVEPIFRSSRLEVDYHYSPPGSVRDPRHLDGVARYTKLHGSLDWRWDPNDRHVHREQLAFGTKPAGAARDVLIYPNAAKDFETVYYPYADLFRDFSAALCRPHSALVTYGYSFGDDHINRVIRDMLTIPSTHLLIITFDDVTGRIARFTGEQFRTGQVSIMQGERFGALLPLVKDWLPWPSDFLLRRRADILTSRAASLNAASPTPLPAAGTGGATPGGVPP